MRFPALAICLAALAAVILVAYADAPGRSLATSPPSAQRFSIDMDPANAPANTANSLGSNETCAAMNENNILDADEDFVDTVEFDVTVTGIPATNSMIGYAYTLSYPAPNTRIVYKNSILLYSLPGSGIPPDPNITDTDGTLNVAEADPGAIPASSESGSGVLDRLRIETTPFAVPGIFPLTLSGAAHVDTNVIGHTPDALDYAHIEVNLGGCSLLVETEIVSMSLTSANPIPIGSYSTVTVDMTIRNNGPQSANTDANTTFNVPPGCTLNNASGTVALNSGLGVIPPGTSVGRQETPSLFCTSPGSYQMPVTACGQVDDPQALDPLPGNDCMAQNLNFDVVAPPGTDADSDGVWDLDEFNCGVSTFGVSVFPERLNGLDDDGDTATDEALPPGGDSFDCDGDGYVGTAEAHVFGVGRDQARCGLGNWPTDFVTGGVPDSTDRINVLDLVAYLAPTRHLNTNVGDNPGNVRWDIVPGKGVFSTDINVEDLISLIVMRPAMFSGARAFNWEACTP